MKFLFAILLRHNSRNHETEDIRHIIGNNNKKSFCYFGYILYLTMSMSIYIENEGT